MMNFGLVLAIGLFTLVDVKGVASYNLIAKLSEMFDSDCTYEKLFEKCRISRSTEAELEDSRGTFCKKLPSYFDCLHGETDRCEEETTIPHAKKELEKDRQQLEKVCVENEKDIVPPDCLSDMDHQHQYDKCRNESSDYISSADAKYTLSSEDKQCLFEYRMMKCYSAFITNSCGKVIGVALDSVILGRGVSMIEPDLLTNKFCSTLIINEEGTEEDLLNDEE